MYIRKTLKNGIKIIAEHIPYVHSISLGLFIQAGSVDESTENNGISHFIEHMLFKGTKTRTAKDIVEEIDFIGAQLNAYTTKEYTCFYVKTLDSDIKVGADILSDMFFNSKFECGDISMERNVIKEEIRMCEDSPEELVHDLYFEYVYGKNPLGRPILGTFESLDRIGQKEILDFIENNYKNTVISVCGNFDFDALFDILSEKFDTGKIEIRNPYECSSDFINGANFRIKPIEQVHMCMGFNGVKYGHDLHYPIMAMNNCLGGGMSSRLFQKVREEKGLAYSIYSYPNFFRNNGLFSVYAAMNPANVREVIETVNSEIANLKITERELEKSKAGLRASFIMSLESTSSRMTSMGSASLMYNKVKTPEEILERINAITLEDIKSINIFKDAAFCGVGPEINFDIKKLLL